MNNTCSPIHVERLRKLHARDPNFGVIGHLWAERIATDIAREDDPCESYLDYGCGRSGLLERVLNLSTAHIHGEEWDPALCEREENAPRDSKYDYVSCIDVLEHVEKDKLDAVLSHIRSLMGKRGIITISLRRRSPRKRKVHPNVHPREWWIEQLHKHFFVDEISPLDPTKAKSELAVLVEPIP